MRRTHQRALHHARRAFLVEERDQRFADFKLANGLLDVDLGIGAERLRRGLHRFLVFRRERPQGMLHAVAKLAQHIVRNVDRVLGDEVHADALGADQPHNLR